MSQIKESPLKFALIGIGALAVIIIIIVIIVAATGSKKEPTKPIPTERDELVEYIFANDFPKKEEMNYTEFLVKIKETADKYNMDDDYRAWFVLRWIATHITYHSGDRPIDAPGVYEKGYTVCDGYSALNKALLIAIGFPKENVVNVIGYNKINYWCWEDMHTNHVWNAAKINGKWCIIDATHATGSGDGDSFKFDFKPYYYCTPPEEFVRNELPKDSQSQYQVLDPPISRDDFCSMAGVSYKFYTKSFTKIEPDLMEVQSPNGTGILKYYYKGEIAKFYVNFVLNNYILSGLHKVTKYNDYFEVNYNLTTKGPGNYSVYYYGTNDENETKAPCIGKQFVYYNI